MRREHEYFLYGMLTAILASVIVMDLIVWRMMKKSAPVIVSKDDNVTTVNFKTRSKTPMFALPLMVPRNT